MKYYKHHEIFHRIFNSTRFAKIKSWDQQNYGVISLLCFFDLQLFFIKKNYFLKDLFMRLFFPRVNAS